MNDNIKKDMNSILSNSLLYKYFLSEREEILKHKWIESEKAGKDIGFEKALLSWVCYHREGWRNKK
jgi:hypothetical protein